MGSAAEAVADTGSNKQHPNEHAILDRVYHLQRNGFNAAKITAVLNSEGHLTRKGTAFRPMQVSRILSRTQKTTTEKLS